MYLHSNTQGKEPKQVKRGGVTGTTRATQRTTAVTTSSTINEEELKPAKGDKAPIASRVPMREPPMQHDTSSSPPELSEVSAGAKGAWCARCPLLLMCLDSSSVSSS